MSNTSYDCRPTVNLRRVLFRASGPLALIACSSGGMPFPGEEAFPQTNGNTPSTGVPSGSPSIAPTGTSSPNPVPTASPNPTSGPPPVASGGTLGNPNPASGGSANPGAPLTGGAGGSPSTNSGGSESMAPCVDTPPPNGDTCAHAVEYRWCNEPWMNGACAASCGLCQGSPPQNPGGSGGSTTGGSSNFPDPGNVDHPPPVQNGSAAWVSRYWDCCKPACGWSDNVPSKTAMKSCGFQNQNLGATNAQSACQGGSAYMCWDGAPWAVSERLAYGYAAASGSNFRCGRCYQLQFTGTGQHGDNAGVQSLNGKTMIVQVTNNGGVASNQFDLLVPGGGVGEFNACSAQWGTSDLGAQYGGFLTACSGQRQCVEQKCQSVFAGKPELLAGCQWFLGWYNLADNPNVVYQQVACPAAITQRSGLPDPG